MRQIEFRAWDKKAKVMVYPVVVYETQDHVGFSEQTFKRCYDQSEYYDHLEIGDDWYYLFDDKVMQFTGLKDANGKKIFEGDLMRDSFGNLWKCEWSEIESSFTFVEPILTYGFELSKPIESNEVKVIGNIYQNKELLKETQNG